MFRFDPATPPGGYSPWSIGAGGFMLKIGEGHYGATPHDESLYSVLFVGVGCGFAVYGPSIPTEFTTDKPKDSSEFGGFGYIMIGEFYPGVGPNVSWIKFGDGTLVHEPTIQVGAGATIGVSGAIFWFRKKI